MPLGMGDMTKRCLDIRSCLAECPEVLILQENTTRLVHQLIVKLIVKLQRIVAQEWILAVVHIIMIGAGDG